MHPNVSDVAVVELPHKLQKYSFMGAFRPFTYPVALSTCLIGVLSAWWDGSLVTLNAILVLLGGFLLQAGVNLINDYADLDEFERSPETEVMERLIRRNFSIGMVCFALAIPIGLYLAVDRSLELLWLFVLGLIGALGYTMKPLNYKARGLAVVMVFWLMGVLMVCGSYVAAGGSLNPKIFCLSLPISCLVSLLLLSNEMRDYESDVELGLNTLTVRMGYSNSIRLYYALMAAPIVLTLLYALAGWVTHLWLLVVVLPFMWMPTRYLSYPAGQRRLLTPGTGRMVLVFGLVFCFMLQ